MLTKLTSLYLILTFCACFDISLRAGGNIYYTGDDSLALMGLIDASECPPTYGASKSIYSLSSASFRNVGGGSTRMPAYV